MLLHQHLNLFALYPPEKIIVSIDSFDPDTYRRLRGVGSSSLSWVLENVGRIRRSRNRRQPLIKLNFTVQPQNVHQLHEIAVRAPELGFDEVSVSHLQWSTGGAIGFHVTSNAARNDTCLAKELDLQTLEQELEQLPVWVEQHPILRGPHLRAYYRDLSFWIGRTCSWPRNGCYILPDGSVYSCATFRMGSLRFSSLPEIWTGKAFAGFRKSIETHLLSECRTCCHLQFENSKYRRFID
jgi:MoaA/NifB/PqqE/SkfB family radical SAM enzyme